MRKMVKLFRDSVTVSDVWVSSNDEISDFYASSWQRGESAVPMLVLRLMLSVVALTILVWSLVEGASPYWLIYLTNWGLLLVTMMVLSGLAVSCVFLFKKSYVTESAELPWFVSMYWFLQNVSVTVALLITALYWILLYDPSEPNVPGAPEDDGTAGRRMFWLDLATHGFNSCVAVIEVAFARTPMRLLHFYQPLGVGLWYAAFTAIYYAAGGTDALGNPFIYEILDWQNGQRAGSIVGISVAGLLIVYAVLWALVLGREKLSTSMVRTTSHHMPPTPPDTIMHKRIV